MSFSNLKKNNKSIFAKLSQELEKSQNTQSGGADERLWKPEMDVSGNGYAVIRFLPAPDGEDIPWAKLWSHAFQGPGGWYIENSLTTMNQKDPVSEYNRELWNSGSDKDKETVRKQKRKLSYYANIYVVQDPKNPENEGRVFLYKFGKKIFDKITEAMEPAFADESPVNPFDFWEGADFKLKLRKVDGYGNYDKSEFASPSPLMGGDDAKLEALWKSQYSLADLTAPDKFKSYDQLKARLDLVLGKKKQAPRIDEELEDESEGRGSFTPNFNSRDINPVPQAMREELNSLTPPSQVEDEDLDESLSYFQRLADA